MNFIGIIPARYASTRFPGKPLVDIGGKSMIQRVYEQTIKCKEISKVYVATDDERIFDHVITFGGNVIMTSTNHRTGTERCMEATTKIQINSAQNETVIINIQGDEPFIDPAQLTQVTQCFFNSSIQLASLVMKTSDILEIQNPNRIKVVLNHRKEGIYFSRSPIPFSRGVELSEWTKLNPYYLHIGIYAYRLDVLTEIVKLTPSTLEIAESLEQLRWIENGYKIQLAETFHESISIDAPEDLEKIQVFLNK